MCKGKGDPMFSVYNELIIEKIATLSYLGFVAREKAEFLFEIEPIREEIQEFFKDFEYKKDFCMFEMCILEMYREQKKQEALEVVVNGLKGKHTFISESEKRNYAIALSMAQHNTTYASEELILTHGDGHFEHVETTLNPTVTNFISRAYCRFFDILNRNFWFRNVNTSRKTFREIASYKKLDEFLEKFTQKSVAFEPYDFKGKRIKIDKYMAEEMQQKLKYAKEYAETTDFYEHFFAGKKKEEIVINEDDYINSRVEDMLKERSAKYLRILGELQKEQEKIIIKRKKDKMSKRKKGVCSNY